MDLNDTGMEWNNTGMKWNELESGTGNLGLGPLYGVESTSDPDVCREIILHDLRPFTCTQSNHWMQGAFLLRSI